MADTQQPEALRLADAIRASGQFTNLHTLDEAAAELRRQHARIAELEAQLEAIGAGGVNGPLMGSAFTAADMDTERQALIAYLKDCDESAIVPDVGGAWHAAFQAGRASAGFTACDMATASAQGFRDGVASLSAAGPADDAIFEFWWADHMPKATQSEAWAEWCALRSNQPAPALTQGAAITSEPGNQASTEGAAITPETGNPVSAQGAAIAAGAQVVKESLTTDIAALTRQEICDIFSFLEGAVTETCYMRIVRLAEKIQTDALRASHGQAPAQPLELCMSTPPGWRCTRKAGHEGPCAAVQCPEELEFVARGMARLKAAEAVPQAAQQAPAGATVRHLEAVIKDAADKLEAAMRCHPNAAETLTREALEILQGDPEPFTTAQAAPAAGAVTGPPNAITASVMRDDGGERPAFCLMAAYRSEKDAMDALAMLAATAAPSTPASGGWLPIETAPKDMGAYLFLCSGVIVEGFVDAAGVRRVRQEAGQGWRTMWRSPTHWQPLPASPTIEGKSK